MPKLLTLADFLAIQALNHEPSSKVKEGTEVSCSQSHYSDTRVRANMCELDVNKTSRNAAGFPLKVIVRVKRGSSKSISSCYLIDHRAEYNFWIPYDSILSDNGFGIISKIILLMNVPFSLDHKLKWKDGETTVTLENKDMLISKVVQFARSLKNPPSLISNEDRYMILDIESITRLPETEFMEMYNNMDKRYNYESWDKSQKELESRIKKYEVLQKEVGIKKMRFEGSAFENSNLSDLCSICWEEFWTGSMVCCINHCSHVYHEVCILGWLLTNLSCPYCRSELGKKSSAP